MREVKLSFIHEKLTQILRCFLCFGTVSYPILYVWISYFRLQYPFELEWIEGGMVDQVQRIVHGQGVYVAPSIDFVPFLYPPLYFYLSAIVSTVVGDGLFPLRLVSFVASLVSVATIFLIVRAETKDPWAALLSASLFTATFRAAGAWLDIARVDSLFLALCLLFFYFVRRRKSLTDSLLTGTFVALAILTKQTAVIVCLPVIVYLFWRDWKYALALLAVAGLLTGTITLLLDQTSGGWYTYYVFDLLGQQTEWLPPRFISFWIDDLFLSLPLAVLLTVFFLVDRRRQKPLSMLEWLSILTGAVAGTFLTRVKVGGYYNVLLPAYAVLSILFGLGLGRLLQIAKPLPATYEGWGKILIDIACLIQLAMLFYNPYTQIPTSADLQAGHELVQFISRVDGEVFLPDHGYISTLAGKQTYAHHSAIWDIMRGNQQTAGKALLTEELNRAIRLQTFAVIVLDSDWNYCCAEIDQYYTKVGEVFQDGAVFYPVTGWKKRPTNIYVPRIFK